MEGSWMMGLEALEVYNTIFNITEENNKFKHFKLSQLMNDEGIKESVRNVVGKNLGISDVTLQDLLDETTEPIVIEEHTNLNLEKNVLTLLWTYRYVKKL